MHDSQLSVSLIYLYSYTLQSPNTMSRSRTWDIPAADELGEKLVKSKEDKGRESSLSFLLAIKYTVLTKTVVYHSESLCKEENINKYTW